MLCYLADFAAPLHTAFHRVPFRWTEQEDDVYRSLKVDASEIAIGGALMQKTPPNWYRPMYDASRRLSIAKKNYSTTQREALRIIYSITKFWHYLLDKKFTFHVDHLTIRYLVSKQALTGLLAQWMLHSGVRLRHPTPTRGPTRGSRLP